jgi:MoaA/NifB/PqqE/SkfB family radical SAM enzyme
MIDLSEYMRVNIGILIRDAIRASLRSPRELVFLLQYAQKSRRANRIREEYEKKGRHIPPFLIASITARCNLHCKGCYAVQNQHCGSGAEPGMSADRWGGIFSEAEGIGVGFILLAGGEPLMRPDILEKAAAVKSIVFPVFTNGTLLDGEPINLFCKHRNMVPVLSMEGNRARTDGRRGEGIYNAVLMAMDKLKSRGLFFCASVTVTTENLDHVTGRDFLDDVISHGCKLVFYVEYVPVDEKTRALALSDEDRARLDGRLDELRKQYKNIIFISFPGDEKLTGGCLAAGRGFFHINPDGDAEPCPVSPFSDLSLKDHSLLDALDSALFRELNKESYLLQEHEGGCLLFEKRAEVEAILRGTSAE